MKILLKNIPVIVMAGMLAVLRMSPVSAQSETGAAGTEVKLDPVRVEEPAYEESVEGYIAVRSSTGTRTDTPLREVPQTVNVIGNEELQDRGVTGITEAFVTVPGAQAGTGYGGLGNGYGTYLRGFGSYTGYRDGFRDFGFISARDPVLFERIEVLKGPVSVLYGANDPGGVINYVSKKPRFASAHEVSLTAGSFNKGRLALDSGAAFGEGGDHSYRLVGLYEERDSHRDFVNNKTGIVAPSLAWQIGDDTLVTLLGEYIEHDYLFERGFPVEPEFIALPRYRFLEQPDLNYAETQSVRAMLELVHQLDDGWSLRSAASYLKPELEKLNSYPFDLDTDRRTLISSLDFSREYQRDSALQLELTGHFSGGGVEHTLLAGVEYYRSKFHYTFAPFDLISTIDIHEPVYGQVVIPEGFLDIVAFGNSYGTDTAAFYVQDQMTLNERWKATLGLRYDHARLFNDHLVDSALSLPRQTQTRTSPRAGLVYEPDSATALFAGYSSSFNPQIFFANEDGELPTPETGKQLELGWRESWLEGALESTLSLFEIRKQNVSTADPENPLFVIQVGEQRSRGAELEVRGMVSDGLGLIFASAWIDAEVTRDNTVPVGDRLDSVAEFSSSVWIKYEPQAGRWSAGGGVFHYGEREGALPNTGNRLPAETRLDALLGYNGPDDWEARLNLRNITDEETYLPYSGLFIPGPGRNADLTVTMKW